MVFSEGEIQMPNFKNDPVVSVADDTNTPAVQGVSGTKQGIGVSGRSTYAAGVLGESAEFNGVLGVTTANGHSGVAGVCDTGKGNGVYGRSKQANGVIGYSSSDGSAGVAGANDEGNGNGVFGRSAKSDGVVGVTTGYGKAGVAGVCETGNGNGVYGRSKDANGVIGTSSSAVHAGVAGVNDNSAGVGIYGKGGRRAGLFEGDVEVTGDISVANADCAEDFDVGSNVTVEPGTVMVLGEEDALVPSRLAYDKRVAGVVSGAGDYKPGIVLDKQQSQGNRKPIALLGKVFCKVDANYGAIEVGDLLTTSPTLGHGMKADDPMKAFGAVIGKALRPLSEGRGLIPILIALQ
jgi:hypothetical protein